MQLDKLKNDWESLAERDALFAILTDGSKAGGKWDPEEFMATGEAEVETVLTHLASIGHSPDLSLAALDFGCGVGRLTQALARRFAACTGVDISEEMIRKAEAINRYPHCSYLANSGTTLPFADATFGFIYSNIVLQHVPPRFSEQYLREFVRVLAPGGVLVFGVQDSFAVRDLSSLQTRIRLTLRPRSRIQNALGIGHADMRMHCLPEPAIRRALSQGKTPANIVDIRFTNTAAKDFNGKLVYLPEPPPTGFISKQYCAVKPQ